MARFPKNDIVSLIGETPRYDLAESVGPDIRLGDLLDASGQQDLGDMALGYGTAAGTCGCARPWRNATVSIPTTW